MTEDHLQNHYFEYGTVNKIDEVLYAMEIIFSWKLIRKEFLDQWKMNIYLALSKHGLGTHQSESCTKS